jgi:hypothetical protein
MCGARFYSVAGGEGTGTSPHFEPRPRRPRRPPDPAGPALGYASLACAIGFPILTGLVAQLVPEAGAVLVTIGCVFAIVFGAAFGFGGLKLSAWPAKLYGALGMGLSVLQAAWLAAALWVGEL